MTACLQRVQCDLTVEFIGHADCHRIRLNLRQHFQMISEIPRNPKLLCHCLRSVRVGITNSHQLYIFHALIIWYMCHPGDLAGTNDRHFQFIHLYPPLEGRENTVGILRRRRCFLQKLLHKINGFLIYLQRIIPADSSFIYNSALISYIL